MPKIALIEDDRMTSDRHRKILESLDGAVVFQAFNYEDAVRLVSPGGFDLMVVDIDLGSRIPGEMEGFKVLQEFGASTTTIIVTGMPEENLRTVALQLKAYEFIEKPVIPVDLINKAKHALAFESPSSVGATAWPKGLSLDQAKPPGVCWKTKPVQLTLTELTIVYHLANSAGKTADRRTLTAAMKSGDAKVLPSHILGVRKKFLAVDQQFDRIESDPGLGYFWKPDD